MNITEAYELLKSFSCTTPKSVGSETEKMNLREALLLFVQRSDSENIGVCAENSQRAQEALARYLTALGYQVPFALNQIEKSETPVYLKCNTSKMTLYMSEYEGEYRGVLVSCQSEEDIINGVYGYLPLDLF